ncbi:hypothetical protein KIN20_032894 [Parelaphostrongylus tenuis]|uniref:Uncharacterized protein n=1 Tax=Parelaphostrongylus tenuis TaxID=148309 RepID=A0AAD5R7V5_PARTN|nr:hypothetical protein KIN20_032894 [Parelaphostrongylus tenuis]
MLDRLSLSQTPCRRRKDRHKRLPWQQTLRDCPAPTAQNSPVCDNEESTVVEKIQKTKHIITKRSAQTDELRMEATSASIESRGPVD